MRKFIREVKEKAEIYEIIKGCEVLSLALHDGEFPYVIPLNFGAEFDGESFTLYFHCAKEGKKIDLIRQNNKAAFEMNCSRRLVGGDKACDYTMKFESVCGTGEIDIIEDFEEKRAALESLMKQYGGEGKPMHEAAINMVGVLRLRVGEITGKRSK